MLCTLKTQGTKTPYFCVDLFQEDKKSDDNALKLLTLSVPFDAFALLTSFLKLTRHIFLQNLIKLRKP